MARPRTITGDRAVATLGGIVTPGTLSAAQKAALAAALDRPVPDEFLARVESAIEFAGELLAISEAEPRRRDVRATLRALADGKLPDPHEVDSTTEGELVRAIYALRARWPQYPPKLPLPHHLPADALRAVADYALASLPTDEGHRPRADALDRLLREVAAAYRDTIEKPTTTRGGRFERVAAAVLSFTVGRPPDDTHRHVLRALKPAAG